MGLVIVPPVATFGIAIGASTKNTTEDVLHVIPSGLVAMIVEPAPTATKMVPFHAISMTPPVNPKMVLELATPVQLIPS